MNERITSFYIDALTVKQFPDRAALGQQAGEDAAECIRDALRRKDEISMMFAAAPSQNETLAALKKAEGIDWGRITAYHMDEYIGTKAEDAHSFRNYLTTAIFDAFPFKRVELIAGEADDPEAEAQRYEQLLKEHPPEIIILGIGENGHLAFNDPPDAKFDDERWVRVIQLSHASRQQQVHDGNFSNLALVPEQAVTVTIPALMQANHLFCVVPGSTKADAVKRALKEEISEMCPASVLRRHPRAVLYIDAESGAYAAEVS